MPQQTFLRRVLLLDAIASGATGALMLAGSGLLQSWLGLPAMLLRFAGASLLPFAALVAWLALRARLSRAGVWAVIAVNVLWVVESVLLLVSGWVEPALLGTMFVLAQALVVAAFAELQFIGLRRTAAA